MAETNITKEFLEEVLRVPVDRFEVKAGSNLGDNYACLIHSVAVYPQDGDSNDPLNIVIKCYPNNQLRQDFLESSAVFEIELGMYQEVIPELKRFQEEAGIEEIVEPPFPKFYYGRYVNAEARKNLGRPLQGLDNCIIMPDLRTPENGPYRLRDRFLGLDHAHYQLVIEAHAKLHALSWAYKQRNKTSILERFPCLSSAKMEEAFKGMENTVKMMYGTIKGLFPGNEQFSESIDFLTERYLTIMSMMGMGPPPEGNKWTADNILKVPATEQGNDEPWLVLLHGDAWSNNMMFRYDPKTDRPVEVLLIDLQMSREGDPLCDLHYTLHACTSAEFRQKHWASMLHLYHDTFLDVCNRLGVEPLPGFTMTELKRRWHRSRIFGACLGLMAAQVVLKPANTVIDLETVEDDGDEGQNAAEKIFSKVMAGNLPSDTGPLKKHCQGLLEEMIRDGIC